MCIYEVGEDAPSNDGVPFAMALFSWSTRMLSYSEPSLHQKGRALYFAMTFAHRLLWEAGVDTGPVANEWIEEFRMIWEGQKGRRLSCGASQLQVTRFDYEIELPRFLSQVGCAEAWSTDFLTREKVHVNEHCIAVSVKHSGRVNPRIARPSAHEKRMLSLMSPVYQQFLPEALTECPSFVGRMVVIGDAGTGKTMLTKQLFSSVAQAQVKLLYGEDGDACASGALASLEKPLEDISVGLGANSSVGLGTNSLGTSSAALSDNADKINSSGIRPGINHILPIRIPLIDWSRLLENEPDIPIEADPVNDLLTVWMQRKYGQDSVPHRLLMDVREARLSSAKGTSPETVATEDADEDEGQNRGRVRPGDAALFLLLDGFDEGASVRNEIMTFLESLQVTEPGHFIVITTRPGTLGAKKTHEVGTAFVLFI
jgi:hypothetical protein